MRTSPRITGADCLPIIYLSPDVGSISRYVSATYDKIPLCSPEGWVEGWEKRVGVMRVNLPRTPTPTKPPAAPRSHATAAAPDTKPPRAPHTKTPPRPPA